METGNKENTIIPERRLVFSLSQEELAHLVRSIRSRFQENPLLNLDLLGDLGIVLASMGIAKSYPALRLLGDLFVDLPEKVRPIFSLRYSLIGTIGEVQALAEDISREIVERILKSLREIEDMADKGMLDEKTLLEIIGSIYDLLNVKIPSLVAITEEE